MDYLSDFVSSKTIRKSFKILQNSRKCLKIGEPGYSLTWKLTLFIALYKTCKTPCIVYKNRKGSSCAELSESERPNNLFVGQTTKSAIECYEALKLEAESLNMIYNNWSKASFEYLFRWHQRSTFVSFGESTLIAGKLWQISKRVPFRRKVTRLRHHVLVRR